MPDDEDQKSNKATGLDVMPVWVRVVLTFVVVAALVALVYWAGYQAVHISKDDDTLWSRVLTIFDSGLSWVGVLLGAALGVAVQAPRVNDYRQAAQSAKAEAKDAAKDAKVATEAKEQAKVDAERAKGDVERARDAIDAQKRTLRKVKVLANDKLAASRVANSLHLSAPRGGQPLQLADFSGRVSVENLIYSGVTASDVDPAIQEIVDLLDTLDAD